MKDIAFVVENIASRQTHYENFWLLLAIICNMKHLLTALILTLSLASCRKDKILFDGQSCTGSCYILTGRLSEFQSNSALPGVQLDFYYHPPMGTIFNQTEHLGKTTTAADGSYTFKFNSKNYKDPLWYFTMEAGKDGYIYEATLDATSKAILSFHLDSSKINVPKVNNLELYKAANLKFVIKASTITNFDFLDVAYGFGRNSTALVLTGK